jgi:hypothetical protein
MVDYKRRFVFPMERRFVSQEKRILTLKNQRPKTIA